MKKQFHGKILKIDKGGLGINVEGLQIVSKMNNWGGGQLFVSQQYKRKDHGLNRWILKPASVLWEGGEFSINFSE